MNIIVLNKRAEKRYLDGEFYCKASPCCEMSRPSSSYSRGSRASRRRSPEPHERYPAGPHRDNRDAVKLDLQLLRIALDQTRRPAGRGYPRTAGSRSSRPRMRLTCENLECVAIGLAGPDPQGAIDWRHEYLAVADLAGAGARGDDFNRLVREI